MNDAYRVLVVEDETNIASFITAVLKSNGYDVLRASNGSEAFIMISSGCPDIVILDLGLPDIDGQKIIKTVRTWSQIPIIVVTARTRERDKIAALDLGADDYITKPFGTGELLARIRTSLRHASQQVSAPANMQNGAFSVGGLVIDYGKHRVFLDGNDCHVTQNEFKILSLLSRHAGRVLTYDYIIKNIWGQNPGGSNQVLRVHMANIRRKIEKNPANPQYIFTEMGVGYRMAEND